MEFCVDLNYFWAPIEDKEMCTDHNLCRFAAIAVQWGRREWDNLIKRRHNTLYYWDLKELNFLLKFNAILQGFKGTQYVPVCKYKLPSASIALFFAATGKHHTIF